MNVHKGSVAIRSWVVNLKMQLIMQSTYPQVIL
jgi:hypothetical protein